MVSVIYSPRYDIRFFGVERMHPFDSRKYGRTWNELRRRIGRRLWKHHVPVDRAVTDDELLLVHSAEYLAKIRQPEVLAAALELPPLKRAPGWLLRWIIVRPMRWATRGTVLAAKAALSSGVAVNLSGGYHHAKPDRGESFCLFSDIALAVRSLRAEGLLREGQGVAYIDLDAHQGNGVCYQVLNDKDVFIFDMYNSAIYPFNPEARRRIDCDLPLPYECRGVEYLRTLKTSLPGFLDSLTHSQGIGLGIYNAGTDVFIDDPLGGLALSAAEILERDLFVIGQFRSRGIPVVMLPSGGYTKESYRLIAATVAWLLEDRGTSSAK
ncbi:MAG: histone deacetylase [Planctomycetes bacterium]|nr:histone deacetylase [Planctomycetota bacterium]